MATLAERVISEPGADSPRSYARRVRRLALAYLVLFLASLAGIALLAWKGQFFVTLTQRSNVETLILAFLLVFFAYLAVLAAPGAWGALRLASFAALPYLGRDRADVERRKARAVGPATHKRPTAALNV